MGSGGRLAFQPALFKPRPPVEFRARRGGPDCVSSWRNQRKEHNVITPGKPGQPPITWAAVNAKQFESVGYAQATRQLFIKFRNSKTLCFEDIPQFRYKGLMSAPRIDAYFKAYIKDQFLAKEVPPSVF
jgi:hypothetical protein